MAEGVGARSRPFLALRPRPCYRPTDGRAPAERRSSIGSAPPPDRLRLGPHIDLSVSELARAYEEGLPRALEG